MKQTFTKKEVKKFLSTNGIIILILLFGFLIRFFPLRLDYHFWDETVYLQHAEIIDGLSPNNYNEFDFRPPLFPFMLATIFLLSHSLTAAHLLVAGLSTLGILLTFYFGKELFNKRIGAVASLIYLLSEVNVRISHEILVDSILPVFWILTAIFTLKMIKEDKSRHYLLAGIFTGLSILLKFTSLVIPLAVIPILFINKIEKLELDHWFIKLKELFLNKNLGLFLVSILITITPYLAWNQITYNNPLYTFKTGLELSGAPDDPLTYAKGFHHLLPLPFLLGGVLFLLKLKEFKKPKVNVPFIFSLTLVIALQYLIQNKELRFMLPITPFVFTMVASGLGWFRKFGKKKYLLLISVLVILSAFTLPKYQYVSDLFKGDLIKDSWWPPVYQASIWLKKETSRGSIVYTNYRWPALGYYSKREIRLMPVTENFQTRIGEVLTQSGYVYQSKYAPEAREPDLGFLKNDSRFVLNKTFDGVRIFYYKG